MKKKNKITTPLNKRPIACPPDSSGRSTLTRTVGTICRILVIFTAVLGLVIFIGDAFNMGQTAVKLSPNSYSADSQAVTKTLVFGCLIMVSALALLFKGGYCSIGGGVLFAGYIGYGFLAKGNLIGYISDSAITLWNCILERLSKNNYRKEVVDGLMVDLESKFTEAELKTGGLLLLGLVIALIFVPCLIKRSRVVLPTAFSIVVLVAIFTMNISRGTVGIALVIIAFTAVLVMVAYDSIFSSKKSAVKYDTQVKLFEENRPELPDEIVQKNREKEEKKQQKIKAKEEKKKRKAENRQTTVAEEINNYFGQTKVKPAKTEKKVLSPAEKADEKKRRKEIRAQVAAVRKYDRETVSSKAAMGGIAGAVMLFLATVIILIPTLTISSNLEIPWLSEKFNYAREFVTALLQGDDKTLDALDYETSSKNFEPRNTTAENREFENLQMMYLETRTATPIYLRGWVGTSYHDGAWYLKDDQILPDGSVTNAVEKYQKLYKLDEFPDETQKINFFRYEFPDLVDEMMNDDSTGAPTDFTSKVRTKQDYGFSISLVGMRRINLRSSEAYLPSYYDVSAGLKNYGTLDASQMKFVNYFDGIFTGRSFSENVPSGSYITYSSLVFNPIMTNPNWINNIAKGIGDYNLQKEAILAQNNAGDNLSATVTADKTTGLITVTYSLGNGKNAKTWEFTHDCTFDPTQVVFVPQNITVRSVGDSYGYIKIETSAGTLRLEGQQLSEPNAGMTVKKYVLSGIKEVKISYAPADSSNLFADYREKMTDASEDTFGSRKNFNNVISAEQEYAQFVYDTYTDSSNSLIIKKTANDIINLTGINIDRAAARSSVAPSVYVTRNQLVRAVIDYMIKDEGLGCKYRLTLENQGLKDETLDGVENFLTTTKEGYCVQFASAAALILREYGIPARYVEGYIGARFESLDGNGVFGLYKCYVHDYEAHAWIEVYYDGIGWVQYETTPAYYTAAYGMSDMPGTQKTEIDKIIEEFNNEDETTERVRETEPEVETDENGETLSDEEIAIREMEEAERLARRELMKKSLIGLAIIAGIVIVVIILRMFANKATEAERNRERNAETILGEHYGESSNETDRREAALLLIDSLTSLLDLYGVPPKTGEQREEYAARIADELPDVFGQDQPTDEQSEQNRQFIVTVMNNIAAEEFGNGMTPEQMKPVATFFVMLRRVCKKHIPLSERIILHYFKRKI